MEQLLELFFINVSRPFVCVQGDNIKKATCESVLKRPSIDYPNKRLSLQLEKINSETSYQVQG
jgi:hypothetical protein